MSTKYSPKNYSLFEKYLSKISKAITTKFGSRENIITFLEELCNSGHVGLAARKTLSNLISPLLLYKVINSDRHLSKCVKLALTYAAEMAEAVLYDRAINGYEELIYNEQGECISKKKKYCSKSLLEYLKANSPKYQTNIKNVGEIKKPDSIPIISDDIDIFEVEAYKAEETESEEEANS
ncbi:hypothetical protein [Rickettsia endosymbiont of Halotydeus destructor]|uniref:hypothetical protein n=1 Tax=Rickettsia endosymbiont of Halotydeus destructor TaxID=2996754 RepID=UPI003BB1F604